MVAEANNQTPDHAFVAQFNASLAEAKAKALALLSAIVAGAETQEVPQLRERRLAASQILRTPFLKVDQHGNVTEDRRRNRSRARRHMGLADATHGTQSSHQVTTDDDESTTQSDTKDSSPCLCASVVNPDPDLDAQVAALESWRVETKAAMSRLSPAEREQIVKQALATLRIHPRAPV